MRSNPKQLLITTSIKSASVCDGHSVPAQIGHIAIMQYSSGMAHPTSTSTTSTAAGVAAAPPGFDRAITIRRLRRNRYDCKWCGGFDIAQFGVKIPFWRWRCGRARTVRFNRLLLFRWRKFLIEFKAIIKSRIKRSRCVTG